MMVSFRFAAPKRETGMLWGPECNDLREVFGWKAFCRVGAVYGLTLRPEIHLNLSKREARSVCDLGFISAAPVVRRG